MKEKLRVLVKNWSAIYMHDHKGDFIAVTDKEINILREMIEAFLETELNKRPALIDETDLAEIIEEWYNETDDRTSVTLSDLTLLTRHVSNSLSGRLRGWVMPKFELVSSFVDTDGGTKTLWRAYSGQLEAFGDSVEMADRQFNKKYNSIG